MRVRGTLLALLLPLLGCEIDRTKLAEWKDAVGGDGKLAGYLADPARPLELRTEAALYLFEIDRVDHIIGVLNDAAPADRERLVEPLAASTIQFFESETPHDQTKARDLAYHLLEHSRGSMRSRLAAAAVSWGVGHFGDEERVRSIETLLLAAAVAAPEVALPPMLEMARTTASTEALYRMHLTLETLKSAKVMRQLAHALLEQAKRRHPRLPRTILQLMERNGNETLMRYLLEIVRDPKVAWAERNDALNIAVDRLKQAAIPGLLRLMGGEDPENGNITRWAALERIWDVGGVEHLAESLTAMPEEGTYPQEGEDFKGEVDRFCNIRLSPKKAAALPILTSLIEHENWVTRVFAAECIIQLQPDDAPELLSVLEEDDTELHGWTIDQVPTLGDVVRGLQE